MTKVLALSTVALMALSTAAFAGGHIDQNAQDNAGDALNNAGNDAATGAITDSPSADSQGRNATAATVKGGNRN